MDKTKSTVIIVSSIIILLIIVLLFRCGDGSSSKDKNLIVFCDSLLIKPVSKIAKIIQNSENYDIQVIKKDSESLVQLICENKKGDIFFPISDFYVNSCFKDNLIINTASIGYNTAVMMVQKNNPKKITNNLINLTSQKYNVVIGNPNSGSIGKETKKILEKKNIFRHAIENAISLPENFNEIIDDLKNKKADLAINWYAVATWPENKDYVDVLQINRQYATKNKLYVVLLKTSKHLNIAKKIMNYASSDKGKAIFTKYGFYNLEN